MRWCLEASGTTHHATAPHPTAVRARLELPAPALALERPGPARVALAPPSPGGCAGGPAGRLRRRPAQRLGQPAKRAGAQRLAAGPLEQRRPTHPLAGRAAAADDAGRPAGPGPLSLAVAPGLAHPGQRPAAEPGHPLARRCPAGGPDPAALGAGPDGGQPVAAGPAACLADRTGPRPVADRPGAGPGPGRAGRRRRPGPLAPGPARALAAGRGAAVRGVGPSPGPALAARAAVAAAVGGPGPPPGARRPAAGRPAWPCVPPPSAWGVRPPPGP